MRSKFERDFDRTVERVRNANSDQLLSIICPGCKGSLNVQVSLRERTAMSVMCTQCQHRVIVDGLVKIPKWVEVLGCRVETTGQN